VVDRVRLKRIVRLVSNGILGIVIDILSGVTGKQPLEPLEPLEPQKANTELPTESLARIAAECGGMLNSFQGTAFSIFVGRKLPRGSR
jgi:hypothetical protein